MRQFKKQLSYGDFGYYAMLDQRPVAYGWVKHEKSEDYFFKIGKKVSYLCRFYTSEKFRGNGIYPALISALIEHEINSDKFYIAVEHGNEASERGLTKVGFRFFRDFRFYRGLKITFNKYSLK